MTRKPHPSETMPGIALTRRMVAGGAVCALLAWFGFRKIRWAGSAAASETTILALLRHRSSASEIGRLALASWPEMRDRMGLLREIFDDLQLDVAAAGKAGAKLLGERLSARIAMDFSTGRTIKLDGWVLSLAEVRLCALSALNSRMAS